MPDAEPTSDEREDEEQQDAQRQDEEQEQAAPDVQITASVRAAELRAKVPSRVRVTFRGDGSVTTRRKGLPPSGAVPGVTHRDVTISTNIRARTTRRRRD